MKRKLYVLGVRLVLERGAFLHTKILLRRNKEKRVFELFNISPARPILGSASFTECKANGQNLFACEEAGCVKVFVTEAEVQSHMDTREQLRIAECESTYDITRTKWAEKVAGANSIVVPPKGASYSTYIPGRIVLCINSTS